MRDDIGRALRAQHIAAKIDQGERDGTIRPNVASLLRRMGMAPDELGAGRIQERRQRNNQPHQGTREQERRRRQMAKGKP